MKHYSRKGRIGPSEMAQWVKLLAAKSDYLSSILRSPIMVGLSPKSCPLMST